MDTKQSDIKLVSTHTNIQLTHLLLVFVVCILGQWGSIAHAKPKKQISASIVRVTGAVNAINQESGTTRPLKPGDTLLSWDQIVVEDQAKVTINLDSQVLIYLDGKAILGLEALRYHPRPNFNSYGIQVTQGSLRMVTNSHYNHKRRPVQLKAPNASIGVRGTRFWMDITSEYDHSQQRFNDVLEFICLQPTCVMTNEVNQRVMNKPNQFMKVRTRFKRLPPPRSATAEELAYVKRLTPALPAKSSQFGEETDWNPKTASRSGHASGSGGSGGVGGSGGSGDSGGQSSEQEEPEQEKEQEKKQQDEVSLLDDIDWKSILIAVAVLALLIGVMVLAWFMDKKRRE